VGVVEGATNREIEAALGGIFYIRDEFSDTPYTNFTPSRPSKLLFFSPFRTVNLRKLAGAGAGLSHLTHVRQYSILYTCILDCICNGVKSYISKRKFLNHFILRHINYCWYNFQSTRSSACMVYM
jgi:hypothetical protein